MLNFKSFGSEESIEFHDCPVFFKEETVEYLIMQSPFAYESLEFVFGFFVNDSNQKDKLKEHMELDILSESMQGLKVLLISLEIFLSVGKCSFSMLKKVEKYLLKICSLVVKYE